MSKLTTYGRRERRQNALTRREADVKTYEAANDWQKKLDIAKNDVINLYKKLGLSSKA